MRHLWWPSFDVYKVDVYRFWWFSGFFGVMHIHNVSKYHFPSTNHRTMHSNKHKCMFLSELYTFQISSSEYSPRGSMLLRTVPWKRTGSWGIIPNRDLRSWRPTVQMLIPSTVIFPAEGSINLNNTWMRVDFPLPVRPTTPIFSPPSMVRETPFRTRGVFGRYRTCSSPFNRKGYIWSSYSMQVSNMKNSSPVSTTKLYYMPNFLCTKNYQNSLHFKCSLVWKYHATIFNLPC